MVIDFVEQHIHISAWLEPLWSRGDFFFFFLLFILSSLVLLFVCIIVVFGVVAELVSIIWLFCCPVQMYIRRGKGKFWNNRTTKWLVWIICSLILALARQKTTKYIYIYICSFRQINNFPCDTYKNCMQMRYLVEREDCSGLCLFTDNRIRLSLHAHIMFYSTYSWVLRFCD